MTPREDAVVVEGGTDEPAEATSPTANERADRAIEAFAELARVYHNDVHGWDDVSLEDCKFGHCIGLRTLLASLRE